MTFPPELIEPEEECPVQGGIASTVIAVFPHLEYQGGNAKGTTNAPLYGGNAWGQ
jgi:hypothetical protein